MFHKTSPVMFKFHHHQFVGLLLLTLVAAAVYFLSQDEVRWNNVKGQIMVLKQQYDQQTTGLLSNGSSSSSSHDSCDLFSGRWVYDNVSSPLYKESQCSFLEEFTCQKYGRKDLKYQHWRWQPDNCDMPRFNGTALLEKLRGKKVLFVGDSLNRNQWRSMVCLIESSYPQSSNKLLQGHFSLQDKEYNTTIAYHWAPFLVESSCDERCLHSVQGRSVRVHSIEKNAKLWNDADILIFDSYAWWLDPPPNVVWGSYGSSDAVNLTVETGLRPFEIALSIWSDWLEFNVNRTKTKLFFMGASPYTKHDVSRRCYNQTEPIPKDSYKSGQDPLMIQAQITAIQTLERRGVKVQYLPITQLSELRRDAHPTIYKLFAYPVDKKNPNSYADCLHWCLPGVPDVWNEILYSYIMNS